MIIQNRKTRFAVSVCAALLAIASTSALASAMSGGEGGDGDDGGSDSGLKTAACNLIGCPNGNRVCGSAGVTVKGGVPPFVGEVNVTYTCYESGMQ